MKTERRSFLKFSSLFAGATLLNSPITAVAGITKKINTYQTKASKVSIFHTNDLHGRIESCFESFGGLNNIRLKLDEQENSGLLLDAGDFMDQRFSFRENLDMISNMNKSGYHAATLGNHELAGGEDALAELIPYMQFDLVNCNYVFQNESLTKYIKPFIIIHSGPFKIGITGVGHQINGIRYKDPIAAANQTAAYLKTQEKCDLVICLSHLGYEQAHHVPDNKKLAASSSHIDLIVSGHNLKAMSGQHILRNKNKHDVVLSQCAWNGLLLGKTEFHFNADKQKSGLYAEQLIPGKRADTSYANSFREIAKVQFV